MQKVLSDFIRALRQSGVPISSAETLDALQAAQLVGIQNAPRLKRSLGMTLTKRLEHRLIFEQLFDQFFNSFRPSEDSENTNDKEKDNKLEIPVQGQQTVDSNIDPIESYSAQSTLAQQLLQNNSDNMQVNIANAAAGTGAQEMSLFTQIPMISYRVMQELGDNELTQELLELSTENPENSEVLLLQKLRTQLQQQVRDYIEQQYLLFSQEKPKQLRENNLQRVKLTSIDHSHYKLMYELVKKSAKKLASMHNRKKRITKRGLLDVRRTISANAAYDGFLFHTKWKSTKVERAKVMVLCDVSGSVSRVARFLLLFLYSLQDVLPRVRSFVFSSKMGEVTDLFDQNEIEIALSEVMEKWANMPTSYGDALQDFKELALKDIDHRTTIIMLGDARNNYGNSQSAIWEEVYRNSKKVLWLNPEGQYSWNSGDSIMNEYAPYCSHVETCNSLQDLNRILGSLLKHQ